MFSKKKKQPPTPKPARDPPKDHHKGPYLNFNLNLSPILWPAKFQTPRAPFRFNDLPAELRDQIYTYCLPIVTLPRQHGLSLQILHGAAPELQRVSRKFRHEYLACAVLAAHFVVKDCPGFNGTFDSIRIPYTPPPIQVPNELPPSPMFGMRVRQPCGKQLTQWHIRSFPTTATTAAIARVTPTLKYEGGALKNAGTWLRVLDLHLVIVCSDKLHSHRHLNLLDRTVREKGCNALSEAQLHSDWLRKLIGIKPSAARMGDDFRPPRLAALRKVSIQLLMQPNNQIEFCEANLQSTESWWLRLRHVERIVVYSSRVDCKKCFTEGNETWSYERPKKEVRFVMGRQEEGDPVWTCPFAGVKAKVSARKAGEESGKKEEELDDWEEHNHGTEDDGSFSSLFDPRKRKAGPRLGELQLAVELDGGGWS